MTCAICGRRVRDAVLYAGKPVCDVCEGEAGETAVLRTGVGFGEIDESEIASEVERRIDEARDAVAVRSQGRLW